MKTVYITTTLPYVNAKPHIGFAREIIQADVLARYQKSLGKEVFFNTGVDEHGQKIYQKAQENKIKPQVYCDKMAKNFQWFKKGLNIDYSRFIRTTDEEHIKTAQAFWEKTEKAGFIYKKKYQAKYCVGCELEKTDSELDHGKCPDHPNQELELINEENYFFKFSEFEKKLLKFYQDNPELVKPDKRFNEIKRFVEKGLQDFSISRLKDKMPWGIPVPGDDKHVMYVWFDALVNYISVLGWPENERFKKFWNEAGERIQFCGKDNLRQQSAMWQAMLMATGNKNSTKILINGFITVANQKMSKSLGNVISPEEMVERYGTDGTRYLLLSAGTFGEDTDITWEKMDAKYNADLANGLGNLVSRIIALYNKTEGKFDLSSNEMFLSKDKVTEINFDEVNFKTELNGVWAHIKMVDKKLENNRPWELVKTDKEAFLKILESCVRGVWHIACRLECFMPDTSRVIKKALKDKKVKPLFKRVQFS